MTKSDHNKYCLNCNAPFLEGLNYDQEIFCPNCGQSNKDSRLSFVKLLKDAISNIFNLDGRLIHTFRDLIYPSLLSKTYIEGKRKYYVNPARLFIFTLLALITVSLYFIKLDNSTLGVDKFYSTAERSKLLKEYDDLVDTINIAGHEEIVDTIKYYLFYKVKNLDEDTIGNDGFQLNSMGRSTASFGISRYDAVHLPQQELFDKYNVTDFWDKINISQYLRFKTDPAGGIKYVIKNLTWAVFISVLLISFFMKLIYIRNQYYLVEHVVLVLNSHALLFVLSILLILANVAIDLGDNDDAYELTLFLVSIGILYVVQFRTLKKYYKQGFFKTLLKQVLINSAYLIIFNLTAILVAVISLILY